MLYKKLIKKNFLKSSHQRNNILLSHKMIHLNNKHIFYPPLQFYRVKVSLVGLTKKPGWGSVCVEITLWEKKYPSLGKRTVSFWFWSWSKWTLFPPQHKLGASQESVFSNSSYSSQT